jgi:hypothetical protein
MHPGTHMVQLMVQLTSMPRIDSVPAWRHHRLPASARRPPSGASPGVRRAAAGTGVLLWPVLVLALLAGCAGGVVDRGDAPVRPQVDRSVPSLTRIEFRADEADPAATQALGRQLALLDRAVEPKGLLIVYLHGAGPREICGEGTRGHERMLAGMGFHVLSPCYRADYDLKLCGDGPAGCRLEAFDGIDRSNAIEIKPADSIERRVVMGLRYLQAKDPGGDWQFFLDGDQPRWSAIVLSGRSHGAGSAGLIAKHREVARVVMLAGPGPELSWLSAPSVTPIERFFAFSNEADTQFQGHLQAWAAMGLRGPPTRVDGATPPYGGSHQLTSSAPTIHAHSSVVVGDSTPRGDDGSLLYLPVWRYLYGG